MLKAAARLQKRAGGALEVAVVLGSGLAEGVGPRIAGVEIPYDRLSAPVPALAGHPGVAYVGTWSGKRVVAFAGRAHLYQGYSPQDVTYFVRLAAASGARTIVLTNAAGALNPAFVRGDVMLLRDHLNLTGETPLDASPASRGAQGDPFLNLTDAYAPHLRTLARAAAVDFNVHDGIYAGVRGPQYETAAECEALRRLGADAVGMSTVLETIAARFLGLDVLGISLITNTVGESEALSHAAVIQASREGAERVARTVEGTLAAL